MVNGLALASLQVQSPPESASHCCSFEVVLGSARSAGSRCACRVALPIPLADWQQLVRHRLPNAKFGVGVVQAGVAWKSFTEVMCEIFLVLTPKHLWQKVLRNNWCGAG